MGLAAKTAIGVMWSFFEQLLRRGVSILVTLLLARFLVPEDFGLLAMMTVFIAIATALMDSGIKQAVIRKLDPGDTYYSKVFYVNIALGILAYSLLFFASPFIADFYDESRLTVLIRVAGCVVIINAFQVIQVAMLSRDLNFKLQMKANVPAGIASGTVAVLMAYYGFGVWSLITQTVLNALLVVVVYWWVQPWRPTKVFDIPSFKEMYRFGYKLFISGLLNTVSRNIYVLVIAKIFSASVAGLYFFAEKIKGLVISQLASSIQAVTYPALSTLQDDDRKLKEGFRSVMRVTTFMLFPAMLILSALAYSFFEAAFPERWMPAATYLQIMCIVGILYPVHSINLSILKVKGRTDIYLGLEVFKKITLFLILFVSHRYGVIGILIGSGVQSVLAYFPNSYFVNRLINYSVKEQLIDIMPNLGISIVVSSVVFWLSASLSFPPIIKLFLLSSLGASAYLILAKVLNLDAYQLLETMFIKRFSKRA
ncbi:MAG: lipopolysaccharide biosynthesis protein [Perlabentimonas sp.]